MLAAAARPGLERPGPAPGQSDRAHDRAGPGEGSRRRVAVLSAAAVRCQTRAFLSSRASQHEGGGMSAPDMTPLESARWWLEQGFYPIPVPHRKKKPLLKGWPL